LQDAQGAPPGENLNQTTWDLHSPPDHLLPVALWRLAPGIFGGGCPATRRQLDGGKNRTHRHALSLAGAVWPPGCQQAGGLL